MLLAREGLLSLVNTSPQVTRFLQIARLLDILHVSASEKPPIPVLAPNTPPLWSKTFVIREGVENLGSYRHRVAELLGTLPLSRDDCFDTALAVGEALSNAYDHACGGVGSSMTIAAYADRVVVDVRDCGCGSRSLLTRSAREPRARTGHSPHADAGGQRRGTPPHRCPGHARPSDQADWVSKRPACKRAPCL